MKLIQTPYIKKYEGGLLPTADLSLVQEKYQKNDVRDKNPKIQ